MHRSSPRPAARPAGRWRARAALTVVALVGLVAACSAPADAPGAEGPTPADATPSADRAGAGRACPSGAASTRTVAYRDPVPAGVDPDLVSLDLTVPERPDPCAPVPVLVYVHGGAFALGDKANGVADKERLARREGWAFASVNHRLSPNPPSSDPDRVMHPTHVEDVAAAVAWLADEGPALGVDGDRIVLMGHSAGAFLVTLAGVDLTYLHDAGVSEAQVPCVVSLDTRYDPRTEAADGGLAEVMYRNAFGADPAAWDAVSPLRLVRPKQGTPDMFLVTRGTAARRAATQDFADALRDARVPVEVLDARPLDHEGVNAAVGAPGDTVVTPPLVAFLRRCVATDVPRPKG